MRNSIRRSRIVPRRAEPQDKGRLTAFRWRVAKAGVRVASRRAFDFERSVFGDLEAVLAEVEPSDRAAYHTSDPLKDASLLGQLVALPPNDPVAWAKFASSYGFLVGSSGVASRVYGEGYLSSGQLSHAEPVATWQKELSQLRVAVALLGALQARDKAALSEWVTLGDGFAKYDLRDPAIPGSGILGGVGGDSSPVAPLIRKSGLIAAGWCVFQSVVNAKIYARRQLLWDDYGRLRRFEVPESLLVVAWMKVSEAAEGGLIVRRCRQCERFYPVRPTSRRKHDIYCSTTCRMAAYRLRGKAPKPDTARPAASRRRPA